MDTVFQRVGDDSRTGTRRDFALTYRTPPTSRRSRWRNPCCRLAPPSRRSGAGRRPSARSSRPKGFPAPRTSSVALGGPEALGTEGGVPASTTSYVVTAIVLLLLAAGLYWVALRAIPTMY